MLAEAYFAGPAVLEQVRRAERTLEARIIDCFDRAPDRGQVSPLLAKGIVAGLICIARSRLLSGRKDELPLLSRDLSDWALSLHSAFLCPLERSTDGVEQTPLLSPLVFLGIDVEATGAPMGDRALILSALAKLAVQQGYDQLTVRAIRESAGVSSGCFSTHFSGVEACFLEAVDRYIDYLIEHAAAARSGGVSSQDGISHAIQSVCALASSERAVAKLCFVEILSPGPSGVRAFERFVDRMIGLAEMDGEPLHSSGRTRAEASASAIWGILRDEIIGERSPEPQHLAELLTLFATASVDPRFTAGATAEEIENTGIENLIAAS
jgi:AcrR family transcriptional regulator